jgi:hypothetical protein
MTEELCVVILSEAKDLTNIKKTSLELQHTDSD